MNLLGIDVGSSSVKVAVVDAESGRCLSAAAFPGEEAPIKSLQPGWGEQSPADWWAYLKTSLKIALSGLTASEISKISALGISYQMHGLVVLDREGRSLRDAIIWCDSRGVPYGDKIQQEVGQERLQEHLLNLPGNFTAMKLAWVKENEPGIFANIWKIMLPGDYIAYRLTGIAATTPSGLSEMTLWDFKGNSPAWWLMDRLGFPRDIIPDIVPAFGDQGRVRAGVAAELGIPANIPVSYRAGDQPNNALSLGVLQPGQVASTAGTSGVIYGVSGQVNNSDAQNRVNSFAHVNHSPSQPRIGLLACINGTGIFNSWVRKNIAPDAIGYAEMNRLASEAPAGCEGLTAMPFGNGAERILGNRQLGASYQGIDFNRHTRAYLLRAAQEGIVFSLMNGLEVMRNMGANAEIIRAGKANMFLSEIFRQTLADVSGCTIELIDTDGAAGAAKGAGIGIGAYASAKEAFSRLKVLERVKPASQTVCAVKEAYFLWKARLEKTL